ncbi:cupin 2 barrel domain protein [Natronomonas pharaonis DSM 2160]|uniref:Cupin 2 barrel domain protein n=1 Tax=Natronomonas pharaonis (strain ATCC 35678 / DSM 2160 / CIP 103997 / JCM 8858 / NBRC 14720 / NCIMB 2260 / Gabara) TaxID=348780 RepID=A0A1U7EXG7_NATPD|nr:cupin domain-containing protein [Natronomonas pharaonis]CAI49875.1 cupin 2 barrel domain protein [Natronomonas pharaonis DSM 2160]
MTHVSATDLLDELDDKQGNAVEVLDEDSLTVEIARHTAGEATPKNPHTEDELYYVVSGSGKIRVGDDVHSVESGDTVFVEQGLEHDFFDIGEDLVTLIVFADSSNPTSYSMRE